MKALIAESDIDVANFCSLVLAEHNIDFQITHNIDDAIETIEIFNPDKLIICLQLPTKLGTRTTAFGANIIHDLYPSLEIIVITGLQNSISYLNPTVNPIILEKPFTPRNLCQALKCDFITV